MATISHSSFGESRYLIEVTHDPTQTTTDHCPVGSIIVDSEGNLYRKRSDTATPSVDVVPLVDAVGDYPTGFPNVTDTEISWDDSTTTFTLSKTGSSFYVYVNGHRYSFSENQTLVGDGTDFTISEGLWFIYFDTTGSLVASQTPWSFEAAGTVAILRWDASNSKAISFADERHGLAMPWSTHKYLHLTVRTRYEKGLGLSGTIVGDGDTDSHAQVSISNGTVHDEDLVISISDGTSGRFVQELSPIANIPVFYLDGATPVWRRTNANTFPILQGTSRIKYNKNTGGTWSQEDASSNGNFVAMWLFASNNRGVPSDGVSWEEPVMAILGQREDTNLGDARDNNAFSDLSVPSELLAEAKVIYRLIFQTSTAYGNTPHARLRDIEDLRSSLMVLGGNAPTPPEHIGPEDYLVVEDLSKSTTTSSTFQDKLSMTTPTLTGTYRIQWQALIQNDGFLNRVRFRDVTNGENLWDAQRYACSDKDAWVFSGGFLTLEFSEESRELVIQWRDDGGGKTQAIKDARIEIWRVG